VGGLIEHAEAPTQQIRRGTFPRQLPRTPRTNDRPNFRVSKAPNLNDGGDCHQDRQSGHDHVQPARRGCLPFSGLLMVLDGDPQAVHGIAAGPLAERDVVWHCVTPSLASTPSAHKPVARRFGCQTGQRPSRDRNDHRRWGRKKPPAGGALHSDAINEPLTTAFLPPPALSKTGSGWSALPRYSPLPLSPGGAFSAARARGSELRQSAVDNDFRPRHE
jgi:hypothetical protein